MRDDVIKSLEKDVVPRTYKWHQTKLFHANMGAMEVKLNGRIYYGFKENVTVFSIQHVTYCRKCRKQHFVGTRICTTPGCVGDMTKSMRDAMQMATAEKCFAKFANGKDMYEWEYAACRTPTTTGCGASRSLWQ